MERGLVRVGQPSYYDSKPQNGEEMTSDSPGQLWWSYVPAFKVFLRWLFVRSPKHFRLLTGRRLHWDVYHLFG